MKCGLRDLGGGKREGRRTGYVALVAGGTRDCCGADYAGYCHTMVALSQCRARSGEDRKS